MTENADLFHQALTLLSIKHNLKVATPATSIADILLQRPGRTDKAGGADAAAGTSSVESDSFVTPRATFRKYVLPKDVAAKEFYQCMECKERRSSNSFGAAHTHENCARPNIRWYCPVCDSFYAVTHRGYHINKCHSDLVTVVHSHSSSVKCPPQKRPRDMNNGDGDHESASFTPAEKVRPSPCGSPSTTLSTSSCCSHEESPKQEDCSMFALGPQPFSSSYPDFSGVVMAGPLFRDEEEEDQPYMFPSCQEFFDRAPASPLSC